METCTVAQDWARYTPEEHARWNTLVSEQAAVLRGRVTPEFLDGVQLLGLGQGRGIPHFGALSERLHRATGWTVHAVPGLVPDAVFFDHLAHRRFVAGRFLRSAAQCDYLAEPDVFHDVFGHVPLLAHPAFADTMQAYGERGLRALHLGALERLSRLYWYTVEFGLIRTAGQLKLYGAGIVSSRTESDFALLDPSPHRLKFDAARVMRTRYRSDELQRTYFVIDGYEELRRQTVDADFAPLYAALAPRPDLEGDALLPSDVIITRGTQCRARADLGRAVTGATIT